MNPALTTDQKPSVCTHFSISSTHLVPRGAGNRYYQETYYESCTGRVELSQVVGERIVKKKRSMSKVEMGQTTTHGIPQLQCLQFCYVWPYLNSRSLSETLQHEGKEGKKRIVTNNVNECSFQCFTRKRCTQSCHADTLPLLSTTSDNTMLLWEMETLRGNKGQNLQFKCALHLKLAQVTLQPFEFTFEARIAILATSNQFNYLHNCSGILTLPSVRRFSFICSRFVWHLMQGSIMKCDASLCLLPTCVRLVCIKTHLQSLGIFNF